VPLEDEAAIRVVGVFVRRGKKLSPATEMLIDTTRQLLSEWSARLEVTKVST
jgi:hypothetical protein